MTLAFGATASPESASELSRPGSVAPPGSSALRAAAGLPAAATKNRSTVEANLEEHQPSGALFIIHNGEVRALHGGDPTPIVLGRGDSIGEVSLLDGGPVGVSMVAVERTDLLIIRPEHLQKLAVNHEAAHQFFRNVALRLAYRLRAFGSGYTLAREALRDKQ